ncbi:MAG: lytic transglycosylase domain-containing protein [Alphaproteobacteria bacterium]|nr:lytic transglycosylase domain-containing protein [Alphaproteobacteria bacterium]
MSLKTKIMFVYLSLCGVLCNSAQAYTVTSDIIKQRKPISDSASAKAIRSALNDEYSKANRLLKQTQDPKAKKIVDWIRLSQSDYGPYDAYMNFATKNMDWPRIYQIKKNAESSLIHANDTDVLYNWYQSHEPTFPESTLKKSEIMMEKRKWSIAVPELYKLWSTTKMSPEQSRNVETDLKLILTPHDYDARVEMLFNNGETNNAKVLLSKISKDYEHKALLRLALQTNERQGAKFFKDAPDYIQSDENVMYDLLKWYRKNNQTSEAISLLNKFSKLPNKDINFFEKLATERLFLIRNLLNSHDYKDAYNLSKDHHLKEGINFADLEWISGWIALRFLKKPDIAINHFKNMLAMVKSPISIARAEYWIGRALDQSKRPTEARPWFVKASEKQTTLYGQLANRRLGHQVEMLNEMPPTPEAVKRIENNELYQMAKLLYDNGIMALIDTFITKLFSNLSNNEDISALIYALAHEFKRPDLAVIWSRRARTNNISSVNIGYPVWNVEHDLRIEQALVLSIVRQESNFSTQAISPVGARGMMQLMPSTAKLVAKKKKLKFSTQNLNLDPDYNASLGSTYLADLVAKFDGQLILAIAAYNAGPSNVKKWIKQNGKPGEKYDPVDWIELIPFPETRNYVQRVLENLYIYRSHMNYPANHLYDWVIPIKS